MAVRGERSSREAALCIVHVGRAARAGRRVWRNDVLAAQGRGRREQGGEGARRAHARVGKLY